MKNPCGHTHGTHFAVQKRATDVYGSDLVPSGDGVASQPVIRTSRLASSIGKLAEVSVLAGASTPSR